MRRRDDVTERTEKGWIGSSLVGMLAAPLRPRFRKLPVAHGSAQPLLEGSADGAASPRLQSWSANVCLLIRKNDVLYRIRKEIESRGKDGVRLRIIISFEMDLKAGVCSRSGWV